MNNLMANGNFIKWNKNETDFYETVNTFSGYKKRSDKIFELMNLYLDIDFKLSRVKVDIDDKKQIYNYIDLLVARCRELKIPDPSQINFSGNGLHVYWFIDKVNEFNEEGKELFGSNAKECKRFYLNLENELVKSFEDLGADNNAKDLSRVLRIIGTTNSKNGKICESIYLDDKSYKLEEFSHLLKYNYDEYLEFKNQTTTHNAVVNSNQITVNDIYNIVKDIRKFAAQSIKVATTAKKIKTYCENVKQLDNSIDIICRDPNKYVGREGFDKKLQDIYDKYEGYCVDQRPKYNFNKKSKWHYRGERFKNSIKSQLKSDWTWEGFTESWKNASKLGKVAKGLGVAGTVITFFDDFNDNIGSKIANGETPGVVDVVNTATDIGVDLGAGYAAAAAGAAIGGPFGLAAGFIIGVGANAKCIGGKSLVDLAKTGVKCVNNWLFNGS